MTELDVPRKPEELLVFYMIARHASWARLQFVRRTALKSFQHPTHRASFAPSMSAAAFYLVSKRIRDTHPLLGRSRLAALFASMLCACSSGATADASAEASSSARPLREKEKGSHANDGATASATPLPTSAGSTEEDDAGCMREKGTATSEANSNRAERSARSAFSSPKRTPCVCRFSRSPTGAPRWHDNIRSAPPSSAERVSNSEATDGSAAGVGPTSGRRRWGADRGRPLPRARRPLR